MTKNGIDAITLCFRIVCFKIALTCRLQNMCYEEKSIAKPKILYSSFVDIPVHLFVNIYSVYFALQW